MPFRFEAEDVWRSRPPAYNQDLVMVEENNYTRGSDVERNNRIDANDSVSGPPPSYHSQELSIVEEGEINSIRGLAMEGSFRDLQAELLVEPPGHPAAEDDRCCWANLKRRYKAALLGVLLLVALALTLIATVFDREIIQHEVNQSSVSFERIALHPFSYASDDIWMEASIKISTISPFGGTVEGATLVLEFLGEPFGHLDLGDPVRLEPHKDTVLEVESTLVLIPNQEVWSAFSRDMALKSKVSVTLSGKLDITSGLLGGTHKNINLHKLIDVTGMGGLTHGFQLTAVQLNTRPSDQELVADITASVVNPSPVSLVPLGNLTFDIFFEGEKVGEATSVGTNLESGTNVIPLTAKLPSGHPSATHLLAAFLADKHPQVTVVPHEEGATSEALFEDGMQALSWTSPLPPNPAPLVDAAAVARLDLTTTPGGQAQPIAIDALDVSLMVTNPLGPTPPLVTLTTISFEADILLLSSSTTTTTSSSPSPPSPLAAGGRWPR